MYRLIIVDDEEKIAEGIAGLFPWEEIGFEVAGSFQSAREALRFLEGNPVDVVMSDIEMPDMDGIEFCRQLKETGKTRVIFFSSHQNYEYFRSAIRYQVSDYLLKPLRYSELLACMEKVKAELGKEQGEREDATYYGKIVSAVKSYIRESFRDATLEEASEQVNLSPSYLSKIFKEHSHSTFSEYLLKVRMEKACELLGDIRYKSYDIAYYVGYDNPKNFSRAFKAYHGVTPLEYRRQTEKGENASC